MHDAQHDHDVSISIISYCNYIRHILGLPSEPLDVKLIISNGSSLTLLWKPPLYSGGPNTTITDYIVTVNPAPIGMCDNGCSTTQTNFTLSKLISSTTYSIKIEANNCVGTGAPYFTSIFLTSKS